MSEAIQTILMGISVLCLLALSAYNSITIKEHAVDHKIHFQKKEISEKEKLEIEILKERLKKIREGTK